MISLYLFQPYKCDREGCSYASTSLGLLKKHQARHKLGISKSTHEDEEPIYDFSEGVISSSDDYQKKPRIKNRRLPMYASLNRETKVALAKEDDGLDNIVIKSEQYEPASKLPYFCDKCNHVYGRFATIKGLKTHMKFCTGS